MIEARELRIGNLVTDEFYDFTNEELTLNK